MRSFAIWCHDRHRLVIAIWVALLIGFGALAAGLGGGYVNSFSLPGTQSQRALDLLQSRFPQVSGDSDQIVFKSTGPSLRTPAQEAQIARTLAAVARLPSVASVSSPLRSAQQVSGDGTVAFAALLFDKPANELDDDQTQRVIDVAQAGSTSTLSVNLGGNAIEGAEQGGGAPSEVIGLAVAVVVLLVVLGGFFAMTMPLIVAIVAIALSSLMVLALSAAVDIASFAPTLGVLIGLGVGIDYALLIINRFRSERAGGADVRGATGIALDTAGRSVLFAGTTVVIALLGMLALGVKILDYPAIAAALTVALTMTSALTLLPALLRLYGRRIKPAKVSEAQAGRNGFWARWSGIVQRRPLPIAIVAVIVLLVLALPATNLRLGSGDAGTDPTDSTTHQAFEDLAQGFGPGFNGPFLVAATLPSDGGPAAIGQLARALAGQPGVARVTPPTINPAGDTAIVQVFPTTAPQDAGTKDLLEHLRDDVVPPVEHATGLQASIGGATATSADIATVLGDKLPLFIGIVIGLSVILLAVVFRSLVVPLKAVVMNLLSIGAALGVVTFVFQEGHLISILGDATGPIDPFVPVFLFAIVFGLSMDYEVFLVSRMHEEWERTHDATHAVDRGLSATGRVVTAAALIMISVFLGFVLGDQRIIQLIGLGLAAAILFDAFVIRLALVPAIMYLLGRAAWWMPEWLVRRLPRLSVEGPAPEADADAGDGSAPPPGPPGPPRIKPARR